MRSGQVGFELPLGDFLNAMDEVSTRGALEVGLGVGRTEPEYRMLWQLYGLRWEAWQMAFAVLF